MIDLNAVHLGDCLEVLKGWPDNIIDSGIADPPYGLSDEPDMVEVLTHWLAGDDYKHRGSGFMGKSWDSFVPGPATWRQVYRVLKPGATLLCFAGRRTQDLMGIALRLAGFEIFDCIMWVFGQGFGGLGLNVSKAIDKAAGAEREVVGEIRKTPSAGGQNTNEGWVRPWAKDKHTMQITAPATPEAALFDGYNSQIKPAYEPILCARKPMPGTYAENALEWGVSGLNIDGCRVGIDESERERIDSRSGASDGLSKGIYGDGIGGTREIGETWNSNPQGRFPPNLLLECNCGAGQGGKHAPDCVCGMLDADSGESVSSGGGGKNKPGVSYDGLPIYGNFGIRHLPKNIGKGDKGGASRFYPNLPPDAARFKYSPKAPQSERQFGSHPTVKPLALMRWLCRLTRTPTGGIVLDPFAGSGTTLEAAILENRPYIGIEEDPIYYQDILERLAYVKCEPYERPAEPEKKNGTGQLKLW